MRTRAFRLKTGLAAGEALARVARLLEAEAVQARREGETIWSVRTPDPLATWDRRGYSRRNWVGINPFSLITGIKVSCAKDLEGNTVLDVVVDTLRTVLWLGFAAALALIVWIWLPPSVALPFTIVLLGFGVLQWAMSLSLVWSEIERELRSETGPRKEEPQPVNAEPLEYGRELRRLRWRRRLFWVALVLPLPASCAAGRWTASDSVSMAVFLILAGAWVLSGIVARFSRCPRCSKSFYTREGRMDFVTRGCLNCGLSLY